MPSPLEYRKTIQRDRSIEHQGDFSHFFTEEAYQCSHHIKNEFNLILYEISKNIVFLTYQRGRVLHGKKEFDSVLRSFEMFVGMAS